MPPQAPVLIWICTYESYVVNSLILDSPVLMSQMDFPQRNL